MRVVRSPARPCCSMEACHDKNSSAVSMYRLPASSKDSRPPRTAATTLALRSMPQRFVSGAGKSAIVNGLPSGPITYFAVGLSGALIQKRCHEDDKILLETSRGHRIPLFSLRLVLMISCGTRHEGRSGWLPNQATQSRPLDRMYRESFEGCLRSTPPIRRRFPGRSCSFSTTVERRSFATSIRLSSLRRW